MLESQFYIRIVLNIIFGIMIVYAFYRMARRDNQESSPQKHTIMKVMVVICALVIVRCLWVFIGGIHDISFPHSMLQPYIPSGINVRTIDTPLVWGEPTAEQSLILASTINLFAWLGIATYLLCFKSSQSLWYSKIGKFIVVCLLLASYASASHFNYFDILEFITPIVFLVLWSLILLKCKNSEEDTDD